MYTHAHQHVCTTAPHLFSALAYTLSDELVVMTRSRFMAWAIMRLEIWASLRRAPRTSHARRSP